MKKKEITEVVEDSFKILEKLRQRILKEFDADDIHDFRVEVKKLRAFLRLVNIEKDDGEPVIPKLLKTFYGYIGIVRNVHLFRHDLFKYVTDHAVEKPEAFLQLIENEEYYWKKEANELMEDNNFLDVKEKILEALPGKLEKTRIKKFMEGKLAELKELLEDDYDDHTMHGIRKIFKDVLYTWDYLKDDADLPKSMSGKDKLKSLTSALGAFMDKSFELGFLQPSYLNKINADNEKLLLLNLYKDWDVEKNTVKQKFVGSLTSLKKQLQEVNPAND